MRYFDVLCAAFTIGLASVALWRLIAVDVITKPIRRKLFGATVDGMVDDKAPSRFSMWAHTWAKCPWCAGAWITALIVILTDVIVGLPMPLLVFAAARYITGWIGSKDEDYQDQMTRGEP